MAIRVTITANILGVSANTIRNYCKQGILPFEWNAANQRVFDKQQLLVFKNKRSFSGKFYRLRGYTNQKKLLHKAGVYIEQKEKP